MISGKRHLAFVFVALCMSVSLCIYFHTKSEKKHFVLSIFCYFDALNSSEAFD